VKKASDLKKGDKIIIGTETLIVESVEHSDIGKQGVKKSRIVAIKPSGEKVVLIRPSDYPFKT
jgi:translation elongation factor P/translation initiation factor 5A